ncbi:hypothetical protein PHYSODRAFT_356071 [Phytophthora sojae]|uniref:Secreted protein n=1 Tax=Phytophthora sojae (strain P6497) TaxID=1094619 RepID=G5ABG0_PHYSP|nr:hypothetical protein PHYSODRAFT_356071 [Phytophthora sojae]EGZ06685.1 hypothetical protein PHYSODRAFT_356071 [Phytophthora sojae]|eukprot:XP_009537449.1 hypothetical protein PHYSODRAFT_356071 [Phytophthora sojae]
MLLDLEGTLADLLLQVLVVLLGVLDELEGERKLVVVRAHFKAVLASIFFVQWEATEGVSDDVALTLDVHDLRCELLDNEAPAVDSVGLEVGER